MGLADITVAAAEARRRHQPPPIIDAVTSLANAVTSANTAAAVASQGVTTPTPTTPATNTQVDPRRTTALTATSPTVASPIERLQAISGETGVSTSPLQALIEKGNRNIDKAINLAATASPKARRSNQLERALGDIPDIGLSQEVAPFVVKQAEKNDVPPSVLMGILQQESNFNPLATEQGGSVSNTPSESQGGGISQFIPSTAEAYGVEYGDSPQAVKSQIRGEAQYIGDLVESTGSIPGALGGYYGSATEQLASGQTYPEEVLAKAADYTALDRLTQGGGLATPAPPRELPGVYAGSRKVVKELLGPFAQTEDWQDKEPGHSVGGLHDPNNPVGFAGDLPPDEAIVDEIARNLGLDPKEVNYGTTGLESVPIPGRPGYEAEFLPYTHGSGPHVHIGAEYTGEDVPPGTMLGAPSSGGVAPTGSAPGYAPSAPGSPLEAIGTGGAGQLAPDRKPSYSGVAPIQNPLSARAVLPEGFGGSTDGALTALQALLAGDTGEPQDPALATLLQALIPQRRV